MGALDASSVFFVGALVAVELPLPLSDVALVVVGPLVTAKVGSVDGSNVGTKVGSSV